MMTVLKVTSTPPPLESEKLIPNKNTQENSEKKKRKHTGQKIWTVCSKKEKKQKIKKTTTKKENKTEKCPLCI